MMIVVPALAHGENGQEPIVAGIVASDVALASGDMRDRVDAECRVIDRNGAPEEADDEARPTGGGETGEREREGRRQFVAMEPHQLRILGEIRHSGEICRLVAAGGAPDEMTVDGSEMGRR